MSLYKAPTSSLSILILTALYPSGISSADMFFTNVYSLSLIFTLIGFSSFTVIRIVYIFSFPLSLVTVITTLFSPSNNDFYCDSETFSFHGICSFFSESASELKDNVSSRSVTFIRFQRNSCPLSEN